MPEFSTTIWAILGVVAFAGVLSALHLIACLTRNETSLHDLKRRVAVLQWEVAERVKDQREREMFIDEAMDGGAHSPAPAPKAKPAASHGGGH
ncbi:MAG TPA: hypothetical protein VK176_06150 [Phycisphaerales bacterium]|nr:hypothetical protein [Phycisphaerales bacterium]